jgi:hypothetical protein
MKKTFVLRKETMKMARLVFAVLFLISGGVAHAENIYICSGHGVSIIDDALPKFEQSFKISLDAKSLIYPKFLDYSKKPLQIFTDTILLGTIETSVTIGKLEGKISIHPLLITGAANDMLYGIYLLSADSTSGPAPGVIRLNFYAKPMTFQAFETPRGVVIKGECYEVAK